MQESDTSTPDTDLYQRVNHPDGVRAICPECERVVLKDNEGEAWDIVQKHNQERHDGEHVAGIAKSDVPSTSDMLEALKNRMSDREWLGFLYNFGESLSTDTE